MTSPYLQRQRFPDSRIWTRIRNTDHPVEFMLELTPRCGLDCRHCYINTPAADRDARACELSCEEILDIARQAVDLGVFWVTLTGGDPLLREDFQEIYLGLKRLGLLVYVYTNGTLITPEYARFFREYSPRDLYITVYGTTEATYERVTRRPGAYAAFRRGVDLLHAEGVPVCFKAIAVRSNWDEIDDIMAFCREHTPDNKPQVRVGNFLHLRTDGNTKRNEEIMAERLTTEEALSCKRFNQTAPALPEDEATKDFPAAPDRLFRCNAGVQGFAVGYDGRFRLCLSLTAPEMTYDLRTGTLREAVTVFTPDVRSTRIAPSSPCLDCTLRNHCIICPAYAYLEVGRVDGNAPYICTLAEACAGLHAIPTS